uniref:Uncharacterized protein n=1 Tax=Vibrio alginolyticus TaxID=663 RepID=A0A510BNY5_VIBAL|nr:hypothetical protein [Vibrio alginolyticus]
MALASLLLLLPLMRQHKQLHKMNVRFGYVSLRAFLVVAVLRKVP